MSSNKSIAVWCVPLGNAIGIELEVHFNYWRVAPADRLSRIFGKRPISADFAEIGIMIRDARLVDRLNIFIPSQVERSAICDCSRYFLDKELVQGIFNERLTPDSPASASGPLVLRKPPSRIFCRMHRFATCLASTEEIDSSELAVQPYSGGTLCTIQSAALRNCEGKRGPARAYMRLRITMPATKDQNPFVEDVPVYDRLLLSGYDQIEYLDFRLNEARTLPSTVENRMAKDQPTGSTKIKLVAFLTAVPVSAELSVANTEFHKMRLLENRIWSTYAPGIPLGMVVYHWKRVAKDGKQIVDFSAFVKLQIRRSGLSILLKYLLFIFAFGVFGNLAASALESHGAKMFAAIVGFLAWLFSCAYIIWVHTALAAEISWARPL